MRRREIVLVAILLMMGVTPVLGQPKAPGVTDSEIVVGLTAPMSGPAAIYGNLALAKEAWARYVNDQGGVHGRKIKVAIKDDGFNPGRAVANLKELKEQAFMTAGLVGSAVVNAAKDEIAEARLPLVVSYANVQLWARQPRERLRYIFISYPDYADEADFLVWHAADGLGAKKIAVFYQNDDWGRGVMDGVNRRVKALAGKVDLAGAVPYEVTDRELATHALKLREAGADTVLLCALNTHAANLVREMVKIGYRPRLMGSFTIGDHVVMYRLLGELWEGAYFNVIGATVGEPASKPVLDILLKYEPKLQGREGTALAGAASMMLAVEGLKRAGRGLTRETFVEGMEGIRDFSSMGLSAPITFGSGRRHGSNAVRLMRAKKAADGSYEQVTEYQIFKPLF